MRRNAAWPGLLPEIELPLPGVVNIGLLATQELRLGVPARSDWAAATAELQPSLKLRGRPLVQSLGFTVAQLSSDAVVLREGQTGGAVANLLRRRGYLRCSERSIRWRVRRIA